MDGGVVAEVKVYQQCGQELEMKWLWELCLYAHSSSIPSLL